MAMWFHCEDCNAELRYCGSSTRYIKNGEITCRRCGGRWVNGKRKTWFQRWFCK